MKGMKQEVRLAVVLLIASCEDIQQVQAFELTDEVASHSSSLDVNRTRFSCLIPSIFYDISQLYYLISETFFQQFTQVYIYLHSHTFWKFGVVEPK